MSTTLEIIVVVACIFLGARYKGIGLGIWGGVGLLILTLFFGIKPTSAPIDVMLIITAVVTAASVMYAAGGVDYMVSVAEKNHSLESQTSNVSGTANGMVFLVFSRHSSHLLPTDACDL